MHRVAVKKLVKRSLSGPLGLPGSGHCLLGGACRDSRAYVTGTADGTNSTAKVQYKTDLLQSNWVNLGGSMLATNSPMPFVDSALTDAERFYRVVVLP